MPVPLLLLPDSDRDALMCVSPNTAGTAQHNRARINQRVMQGSSTAEFEVVSQVQLHKRYLTLYDRRIRFTRADGKVRSL